MVGSEWAMGDEWWLVAGGWYLVRSLKLLGVYPRDMIQGEWSSERVGEVGIGDGGLACDVSYAARTHMCEGVGGECSGTSCKRSRDPLLSHPSI